MIWFKFKKWLNKKEIQEQAKRLGCQEYEAAAAMYLGGNKIKEVNCVVDAVPHGKVWKYAQLVHKQKRS